MLPFGKSEIMLIFDFDGVLLNSLDEVVVNAYNAVTGKLITSLEELPGDLVDLFKRNRFHFQPAGDAIPLMNWCLENYQKTPGRILTQTEYQEVFQSSDVPLIDRTNKFFSTRRLFIEKNKEIWLSLNAPYQPVWDELIKRGSERVVILTNKNRKATHSLCHHFSLKVLKENIYSGDNGATKIENLNKILKRFNSPKYYFIDDSLKNLRELDLHFNKNKELLTLLFASWGYNGPEDKAMAQAYGYSVLKQEEFITFLDKWY